MVTKLMSDELRGTWRLWRGILLPALIVFLVSLTLISLRIPIVSGVGYPGAVLAMLVSLFSLPVILLIRYYRTLYGSQGYLTMTLPVRGREIYWSRFWNAVVWVLADVVLLAGLLILFSVAVDLENRRDVFSTFRGFMRSLQSIPNLGQFIAILGSYAIFVIFLQITQWGFILSKGSEARFHRIGLGGPVVMYVITYLLQQAVSAAGLFIIPLGLKIGGRFYPEFELVPESSWRSIRESMSGAPESSFVLGLGFMIGLLALGVVYLILTIRSIERHTSLK